MGPGPDVLAKPHAPLGVLATPTSREALDGERMTLDEHFRRDHFPDPGIDRDGWRLEVGGCVERELSLDLDDLMGRRAQTLDVVLECAGHRRTEQEPVVGGLPWGVGAVGELAWTGIALAAVLREAGVHEGATAVVLEGADRGLVPGGADEPFARALPLDQALAPETLLAFSVEGAPIPGPRGGPVRAIVPGWYATDSVKWLTAITVVDRPFTGHFEALDYRLAGLDEDGPGRRMAEVPIHSLVTWPVHGEPLDPGDHVLRGVAWGGAGGPARVDVRIDGGAWRPAGLGVDRGRFARRFWALPWTAAAGPHRIEVRATDHRGVAQPVEHLPNRHGYAVHTIQRIEVPGAPDGEVGGLDRP